MPGQICKALSCWRAAQGAMDGIDDRLRRGQLDSIDDEIIALAQEIEQKAVALAEQADGP